MIMVYKKVVKTKQKPVQEITMYSGVKEIEDGTLENVTINFSDEMLEKMKNEGFENKKAFTISDAFGQRKEVPYTITEGEKAGESGINIILYVKECEFADMPVERLD